MQPTTKKLLLINASLLKVSDCDFQTHLIHDIGLTSAESSFKQDYGSAFHKFKYLYDSDFPIQDCIQQATLYYMERCLKVPLGDFRDIDHLIKTIQLYIQRYPRESDEIKTEVTPSGDKACEVSFALPITIQWFEEVVVRLLKTNPTYLPPNYNHTLNLVNNFEIVLCGTIDRKCYNNILKEKSFADTKVTALWSKENFLEKFETNIQLKFYSYVQRISGVEQTWLPGFIDGVFIKKPTLKSLNKSTGKMETNSEWSGASFERSRLFYFTDEVMEDFEKWLFNRLIRIMVNYNNQQWEQNFTRCETVYGSCDFYPLCKNSKRHHESLIKEGKLFLQREYDPTKFQD